MKSLAVLLTLLVLVVAGCTGSNAGFGPYPSTGLPAGVASFVTGGGSDPITAVDPSDLPVVGTNQVGVVVLNDDDGGASLSSVTGLAPVTAPTYEVTVTWNSSANSSVSGTKILQVGGCGMESFTIDYGSAPYLNIQASLVGNDPGPNSRIEGGGMMTATDGNIPSTGGNTNRLPGKIVIFWISRINQPGKDYWTVLLGGGNGTMPGPVRCDNLETIVAFFHGEGRAMVFSP